ncbi:MAG: ATP synthase F1 subunit epsilon [Calditrichaceae bacterium]|nr:ATP synthase F1 subunit epsilon [Calditrichaceae bacterium]
MTDLRVEIVTPFGIAYQADVESCHIPGALGQFQVLKNHAAMLSLLSIGSIKIIEKTGSIKYLATSGGFCEIDKNEIRIIVESAELSDTINVDRAKEARERAEKRLQQKMDEVDIDRAQLALARALNRLKVAKFR